jgi:PelA/Pel-15E family pectate lyase
MVLSYPKNAEGRSLNTNYFPAVCRVRFVVVGFAWLSLASTLISVETTDPKTGELVFPNENWATCTPESVGLDSSKLDEFAQRVGGDGCVICRGFLVKSWGAPTQHKDWASAAKPVLSTLLILAVEDGKLASVDASVASLGWDFSDKDRVMTFRHLANMVSGYGLDEAPGAAWGYNDYAIQLYAQSLVKLLGEPLDAAFRKRLHALQFEDGEFFGSRNGTGVTASSRDFARLGWLWLNRGRWKNQQLISEKLIDDCLRVGVRQDLPRTSRANHDYLSIGTYGGGTDQTPHGPGVYGFNFWFNETLSNGNRVWPALPADAYQANGMWNRDTLTMIPSLKMVVVSRGSKPGKFEPGLASGEYNQNLKLIAEAVRGTNAAAQGTIQAQNNSLASIDVSGFGSCIHHWRRIRDTNRFIQVIAEQPSYEPSQVQEIVDNILLFQRANGGWPKDYDMLAVLTPEQRAKVIETRQNNDTSYDNGNLHSQVAYLAKAVQQTGNATWREACERGFDFILRSQYSNGGFPQRFPNPTSFHAHITFNDGVMMGIVNLLMDAHERKEHFAWLDDGRRQQAKLAIGRAVDCILKSQIQVDGVRTGWCQQHDATTLEPRSARTFELASICPQETTEIVRFLMRQPAPSQEIRQSIESAVRWLQKVSLANVRVEKVKAAPEDFLRHSADFDIVIVTDAQAKGLWARHYELDTCKPIFAGRDGVKKYSLAEIERERRTGTAWYGGWPESLILRDYPAWREKTEQSQQPKK